MLHIIIYTNLVRRELLLTTTCIPPTQTVAEDNLSGYTQELITWLVDQISPTQIPHLCLLSLTKLTICRDIGGLDWLSCAMGGDVDVETN